GLSVDDERPQSVPVSMLPPALVNFVEQFESTPSPMLPAMIDPPTVIFSASLVKMPSPPFELPLFCAIVERVMVVVLLALSRVEMPGDDPPMFCATVESTIVSVLPAPPAAEPK